MRSPSYKLKQCKPIPMTNILLSILYTICNNCSPLLSISDPEQFVLMCVCVCLCLCLCVAALAGTDMTPNYVDSSFSNWTISPWCTCKGSGNQEEECMNFLRYFTDNTCLSKPSRHTNTLHASEMCFVTDTGPTGM